MISNPQVETAIRESYEEVGVKPKDDDLVPMHKKHHILIVCHHWDWHELEYIKNRRGDIDTYKSQVGRYSDPQ